MSWEVQKYVTQAIIEHLDGNMELFERYTGQAMDLMDREEHLYTPLKDMARIRGIGA